MQTSPPPDGRESSQPSHPTANFSHSHPFHHSSPSLHSDRVEKSRSPVHGTRTLQDTHFHPHSEFLICQSIDSAPHLLSHPRPLKLPLPPSRLLGGSKFYDPSNRSLIQFTTTKEYRTHLLVSGAVMYHPLKGRL